VSDSIKMEVPYFQVPNDAVDDNTFESVYEFAVYSALCRFGNNGSDAFPSHATIANATHCSVSAVRRALEGLGDKGYLIKEPRFKGNIQQSNQYTLLSSRLFSQNTPPVPPEHTPCSPRTTDKELIKKNSIKRAEEIYSIYPKKVGKGVAIKSIEKALKKISFEDLKPIVEAYAEKTTWKDKQYIPAPATWFNQDRWEDDQSEWEAPKPKSNFNTPSHHYASSVDPTKPTMS